MASVDLSEVLEEENRMFSTMNEELDKQVAKDMEVILEYINRDEDSLAKRIEFFNDYHKSISALGNVTNHILYQHTAVGAIKWNVCNKCDYKATDEQKLKKHMENTHFHVLKVIGDTLRKHQFQCICKECNVRFKKNQELLLHRKISHGIEAHACEKCEFLCLEPEELSEHIMAEHTKLKVSWYKCAKCAYRTGKKNNLDRHVINKHLVL